ncbi:hypothetical protein D9M71_617780 [compost metagenome]
MARVRLVSLRRRLGYEAKVMISIRIARPSWVTVDEGGPLERKVQIGWFRPLRVVPTCTSPSWTSRARTSR